MKCTGVDVATGVPVEISFSNLITSVEPLLSATRDGWYVSPGWIDLQVNGFAGVDYNSPVASHADIARSIRAIFKTGVTRFFPTVITGSPEDMTGALRNLATAREAIDEGPAMEGFHVEGPYIAAEDGPRGAHPAHWVRRPDFDEFRRFQDAAKGNIRLITLAPEWEHAPKFIEAVVRQGVVVSIGHTGAMPDQVRAAVDAGATLSTHLGNGAHSVLPRFNYIWEQMAEDRLAASFIVDGIHLPDSFLRIALRAKGLERSILVTDAVMPAGCEPGPYKLGEVDVELHSDGSVRLAGGTRLAGSALTMDRAIENVIRAGSASLGGAIAMASRNPARIGRLALRQRGLNAGERADMVVFRYDEAAGKIEVLRTLLSGSPVYVSPQLQ